MVAAAGDDHPERATCASHGLATSMIAIRQGREAKDQLTPAPGPAGLTLVRWVDG